MLSDYPIPRDTGIVTDIRPGGMHEIWRCACGELEHVRLLFRSDVIRLECQTCGHSLEGENLWGLCVVWHALAPKGEVYCAE